MTWLHLLSYFGGGVFLTNAIPHMISGIMGKPFQSPFATPPGEGLSSSTINVWWGFFNMVIGYVLICHVGDFNAHNIPDILSSGVGVLAMALFCAHFFGRVNGGNHPRRG